MVIHFVRILPSAKMRYFLALAVLIGLCYITEGKKKTCLACKSSSSSSDCQKAAVSDTCEGNYCYAYVYLEKYSTFLGGTNTKRWWIRGCTSDREFCDTGSHHACVLCNKDKCNNKVLTKYASND